MSEQRDPNEPAAAQAEVGHEPEPGHGPGGGHAPAGEDAPDGHADAHAGDAHGAEALGPIDLAAWGAGLAGMLAGLVVVLCFVLATRT
ncbi:MAG TPA: hypothetical protein VF763_04905 [Candidatus Limnocylindrales bacterium]